MSINWQMLSAELDECMLIDKAKLRRRFTQLKQIEKQVGPTAVQRLVHDIGKSCARRRRRFAGLPRIDYPHDLPVSASQRDIANLIAGNQVVIVCGETGSGKTTQLPKICLELGRGVAGLIGHTQPRRLAARSVAARLAKELGNERYVGYKVRFHDTVRPAAYIKVMTDGVLLAELTSDRHLEQYDTLIVDEAHERSLNVDFLLGYLKQVLLKRPELKLIITSATINAERFSAHFDAAPVIEVSGRGYPISVEYRPPQNDDDREADLITSVCQSIESLVGGKSGDVLVFLSGEREIHETEISLPAHLKERLEVLPLYSRLDRATQDRVFSVSKRQKLILATNVAETSITVPNIGYVIDTGQARISRYSHRNKIQRLPIEPISRASAAQRMGRCGRTRPGHCIRLYEQQAHDQWPAFTEPEVRRTNLAAVILRMKALGLGGVERFPFIDPPDRRYINDGLRLLRELGALDGSDCLTDVGRQLDRFPVDPRIARMILAAKHQGCLGEMLVIASVLSIQDPFERPRQRREAASRAREAFTDRRSDFLTYLNFWQHMRAQAKTHSRKALGRLCDKYFVSWQRFREWEDVHRQLEETTRELGFELNRESAGYGQIHRAMLTGSLGLIGQWVEANSYAGARGSQLQISPASALYRRKPQWVMAAELVETSRVYAHRGARIRPEWVEAVAPAFLLSRTYAEPVYDAPKGRVFARESVSIYGLPIISNRRRPYDKVNPQECRKLFIARALVEGKLRTQGDFLTHNQSIVDRLRGLEHKTRRSEMLEDDKTIADIYALRIPLDINRAATFERWRRRVEVGEPRCLHFSEADLKRADAPRIEERDFPNFLLVNGHRFPLRYRFNPGERDDGVTVRVPLLLINQLSDAVFECLVPGRVGEKILALLRSLPKSLRRNFVPLPGSARRCHQTLISQGVVCTERSLSTVLAEQLEQMTGVHIPPDAWNLEKLPPHLLMNFEIIDSQFSVIAEGRDLAKLRGKFSSRAVGRFEQLTPPDLRRDFLTCWPDVALPVCYRFSEGDVQLLGYPAIIDQGATIGVRVFDTHAHARDAGVAGLRRLMHLSLRKQLKVMRRGLADIDRLKLLYVSVAVPPPVHCFSLRGHFSGSLDEEIMRVAIEHCFQIDPDHTRNRNDFEGWIERGRLAMAPFLADVCQQLGELLEMHHRLRIRLRELPALGLEVNLDEISSHLDRLVFRGFLSVVPGERLRSYPRYLSAIDRRIDKLTAASRKDLRRSNRLKRLWSCCQCTLSVLPIDFREGDQVQRLRWMLEELRVATFAQELGTDQTISIERVEAALDAIEHPTPATAKVFF